MRTTHVIRYAFIIILLALPSNLFATDVTLRLVDQNGGIIPASWFYIDETVVLQEGVITLSEGTYTLTAYAGLNGNQLSKLRRNESVDVAGAAQIIDVVWPTATFEFDLLDQDGIPIPGSTGRLYDITNSGSLPMSIVLPVTEDPTLPNLSGEFATGYRVYLYPGVNGVASNRLARGEWDNELSVSGASYDFVWPTATFEFDIVDQDGVPIPGSVGGMYNIIEGSLTPVSIVLPVTEDPDLPNIGGDWSTGYRVGLAPGMNGTASGSRLSRWEFDNELPTGGASYDFVWPTATFEYDIVDQFGEHIPGSVGRLYNITESDPLPASIVLPVTEDPALPHIQGDWATGYRVYLYPGVNEYSSIYLYRHEPDNELPINGASYDFVWPTATFDFDIVDQDGSPIPGSTGRLYNITNSGPLPMSIVLPVTEDPALPHIQGDWATGYRVYLYPGVNEFSSIYLYRHELDNQLPVNGASYDFVWPTGTFEFDFADQDGSSIPGSKGRLYDITNPGPLPMSIVLPVTEDPALPHILGDWATGYRVDLYPGVNGSSSARLYRHEWDNELPVDGLDVDFEWLTLKCLIGLVDAFEEVIPESYIRDSGGTYFNGDMVVFPSTDEILYPTMTGAYENGYPLDLFPGGTLVGSAAFEVTDVLEFDPYFVTFDGNQYGLRCIPPVGSVTGRVIADCPDPNTGLLGVSIDAYELGSGDLAGAAVTDGNGDYLIDSLTPGDYTITIVAPLGYTASAEEVGVTVIGGDIVNAEFTLSCVEITADPRAIGFWKHQVGVALGGKGHAQIDGPTLCGYLDLIEDHFNTNEINQVVVYQPPASGDCTDKLQVTKDLLNLKGNVGITARAKQRLTALLLNVASEKLSLTELISADGATVSQAITYCDNLIDDPDGDHELAKTIADDINNSIQIAAGVIPLSTANIAYRQVPFRYSLAQNYPNPFNPYTNLSFSLPEAAKYTLKIYNVAGRLVRSYEGMGTSGLNVITWDCKDNSGSEVSSGVYFYHLTAGSFSATKKMVMMK